MEEALAASSLAGHDVRVALNLGEATAAASSRGPTPSPTDVPAALRGHRPAWRDPRLWIGIVLVAASVVVGARVLAAADDTVQVWAAAGDLGAGQRVEADDLVAQRVRFADRDALAGYFTVDDELPADLELTRGVGKGELLPRAAVGTPDETGMVRGADRGRARAGAVLGGGRVARPRLPGAVVGDGAVVTGGRLRGSPGGQVSAEEIFAEVFRAEGESRRPSPDRLVSGGARCSRRKFVRGASDPECHAGLARPWKLLPA